MELLIKQNKNFKNSYEIRGDYIIAIKFFYSIGKKINISNINKTTKIQIFPEKYIIDGKEYKEEPELIKEFISENFEFLLKK